MLPSYSRTQAAILSSPTEVQAMADAGLFDKKGDGDEGVHVSEYTPLLEAVYMVVDELRVGHAIAAQGKGRKPKPVPRPILEHVDAARERAKADEFESTIAVFGF